jgi:hypothetical protein
MTQAPSNVLTVFTHGPPKLGIRRLYQPLAQYNRGRMGGGRGVWEDEDGVVIAVLKPAAAPHLVCVTCILYAYHYGSSNIVLSMVYTCESESFGESALRRKVDGGWAGYASEVSSKPPI